MANKGEQGVGEMKGRESEEFGGDLEALLSAADVAAGEAQRAALAGEITSADDKKKQSKAAAERAEQLQHAYALLSAEDSGVDHVGYEWALQAAEEETGIAAPEKSGEVIKQLRRVGDALRRLVAIDPKTTELEGRIEELQTVKERLFEQARDFAMEAIEEVKRKYKGEESKFERTFKQLQESPLTARLEFPPDSPEAREAALKMEITELLFRPTADLLSGWDRFIADVKAKVDEAQAALDAYQQKTHSDPYNDKRKLTQAILTLRGTERLDDRNIDKEYQLQEVLKKEVGDRREAIQTMEAKQRNNLVRFESNRMRVEAILETPASEDEWRTALVEWRAFVGNRERNHQLTDVWPRRNNMKSPLAQRLLDASIENGEYLEHPFDRYVYDPGKLVFSDLKYRGGNWLPDRRRLAQTEDIVLFDNINRALLRVSPKPEQALLVPLTAERKAEGWTESKLGALVPPGGDVRKADREFAAMLERLSHPIASTERAFDVKGEGGEIKVYTLGQAKDLLRRARRDAQRLLLETRGHLERETGEVAKRGERVEDLTKGNANLREGVVKAQKEAKELSEAKDKVVLAHKETMAMNRVLERQLADVQATVASAMTALSTALERKAPVLGGDKELRQRIANLLAELKKQQGK